MLLVHGHFDNASYPITSLPLAQAEKFKLHNLPRTALAQNLLVAKYDLSSLELLRQRGLDFFAKSNYPEAASILSILISSIPPDRRDLLNEALVLRAKSYLVLDQPALALSDLFRVDYEPSEVTRIGEVKILIGVSQLQLKQYQKAIDAFNYAQRLLPNSAELYSNRAVAYQSMGQYAPAMKDLKQSISLKPVISSYFNMAVLARQAGDFKACLQILSQIIAVQSDYPQVFVQRGICAANLGQHDQSITDMLKVLKIDPTNAEALQQMGLSLAVKGQPEAAKKYLEKAASQRLSLGQTESYQEIVKLIMQLQMK